MWRLLSCSGVRVLVALCVTGVASPTVRAQARLQLQGEATGADVIVRGVLEDPSYPEPIFVAVWRGVPGAAATFQWQPTVASPAEVRLLFDRLMEAALGAYLDTRIHFAKDGVKADLPADQLVREMEAMIAAAAEGFGADIGFSGFSEATRRQLERVTRIDWSQARFGIDGGGDQDKYLAIYYYVRSQREELDRQMRADLLPLVTFQLLGAPDASPGTTVRINSTCGTVFDQDNFLCALDLQLADTGNGGVDPELSQRIMQAMAERAAPAPPAAAMTKEARVRKRDRWLKDELDLINQRIDRMDQRKELWELRDRMDDVEARLDDISIEVGEIRRTGTAGENPLADLSDLSGRNLTIHFARYSVELGSEYQVLLNEVFEQLARSPQDRVLITGYTDRSGDPAINLRLSEDRAKAVRNYLLARGIAPERLLVNYYGDSRSMGRNPDERRVEIEWLR